MEKLESVQYSAALAVPRTWRERRGKSCMLSSAGSH